MVGISELVLVLGLMSPGSFEYVAPDTSAPTLGCTAGVTRVGPAEAGRPLLMSARTLSGAEFLKLAAPEADGWRHRIAGEIAQKTITVSSDGESWMALTDRVARQQGWCVQMDHGAKLVLAVGAGSALPSRARPPAAMVTTQPVPPAADPVTQPAEGLEMSAVPAAVPAPKPAPDPPAVETAEPTPTPAPVAQVSTSEPEPAGQPEKWTRPTPVFETRAGETLQALLTRWSKDAGWQLQWELPFGLDYPIEVSHRFEGGQSYSEAVKTVISSLWRQGAAIQVELWRENQPPLMRVLVGSEQ